MLQLPKKMVASLTHVLLQTATFSASLQPLRVFVRQGWVWVVIVHNDNQSIRLEKHSERFNRLPFWMP